MTPELVLDARAELGEGPVWHDGCLFWVNVLAGEVHRLDPAAGTDVVHQVDQAVGAVVPRAGGGLVLAIRDGFAVLDGIGHEVELVTPIETTNLANRMNDGKCDRHGRLWASTMAFAATPGAGTLYRLEPDLTATPMVTDLGIGNGLAWSPDDRLLYFIDSLAGGIDVFDFDADAGALQQRRRFVDIPEAEGLPDGMTIDVDGCLWVALWQGSAVRRYTPDGRLDRVVPLPVAAVTSCTFGGADLGDLYITTAWSGLSDADRAAQSHAGGVFHVRPGVTGTPANAFAG